MAQPPIRVGEWQMDAGMNHWQLSRAQPEASRSSLLSPPASTSASSSTSVMASVSMTSASTPVRGHLAMPLVLDLKSRQES